MAYKNLGIDIGDYPNAYAQYANEITLPLHTLLSDADVEYVCRSLKKAMDEVLQKGRLLWRSRSEFMKKIAILGSANALKPKIIIETLYEMNLLLDIELFLFTENDTGVCADYCKEKGIKTVVFLSTKLDETNTFELAKRQEIDLLVSAGWPYKIPSLFLQLFKFNPINCHGSVLPDYRGNRAYMHYWANCEEYYGATIHYMNERFDDGNILIQGRLKMYLEETPSILHRRSAELCAFLLPSAIALVEAGYEGRQVDGLKRYFKKLTPEEFDQYREYNEQKSKLERKLTPHKIV
ncbi:MAG: formyltransferase family protein [Oscillospiraceae bacterium]|jgi:phosphoribosylglycinamide formyltransferase-1